MDDQRHPGVRTQVGHAVRADADDGRASSAPRPVDGAALGATAAPIEIVYLEENHLALGHDPPWCALEVWTGNHVYLMDGELHCIGVVNRKNGRPDPRHPFLGARLTGGERYHGKSISLAHPLPVPGTGAVFRRRAGGASRFGTTSAVVRVVLRVRLTAVQVDQSQAAWETILGHGDRDPDRRGRR